MIEIPLNLKMTKIPPDDTRKNLTPDSSMMGRPDQ